MKKSFIAIILLAMAIMIPKMTLAEPIPIRGVVEGFYGTPWSQEDRIDILKFCGSHGLNAYIYAPKDDPYHRAKWREPYPADKLKELSELIQVAKSNNVKFIFAVSPGLDLNYGLPDDSKALIDKLTVMYNLGVRDFAIFFDDIKIKDGGVQAQFLNTIEEEFMKVHEDISPLITVPTEYYRLDMIDEDGFATAYTKAFTYTLSNNITILYTGDRVVCPGISDEELKAVNELFVIRPKNIDGKFSNRQLGIWWNYPVNDYMEDKLALGPIENLPRHSKIPAIFFNPMKYEQLSKIALATGADYANDPENYNPDVSWNKAIEEQFGSLAEEMKLFASYNQHLENDWAKVGRSDADLSKATTEELETLRKAIKKLQKKLPKNILNECQPQLKQLEQKIDEKLNK